MSWLFTVLHSSIIKISNVVFPVYLLLMNFEIVINVQFDDAVTFRLKLFTAGLVCAKYNLDLFENKLDM